MKKLFFNRKELLCLPGLLLLLVFLCLARPAHAQIRWQVDSCVLLTANNELVIQMQVDQTDDVQWRMDATLLPTLYQMGQMSDEELKTLIKGIPLMGPEPYVNYTGTKFQSCQTDVLADMDHSLNVLEQETQQAVFKYYNVSSRYGGEARRAAIVQVGRLVQMSQPLGWFKSAAKFVGKKILLPVGIVWTCYDAYQNIDEHGLCDGLIETAKDELMPWTWFDDDEEEDE